MQKLEEVIYDAENFIHKSAWAVCKPYKDVLATKQELAGDGYVVLAEYLNAWDGKSKFPYHFFGKRVWHIMIKKVNACCSKKMHIINIDLTDAYNIAGSMTSESLFFLLGVNRIVDAMTEEHKKVVSTFLLASKDEIDIVAEEHDLVPNLSWELVGKMNGVPRWVARKYLLSFFGDVMEYTAARKKVCI